jgi:CHAD domain-containing protein
MAPNSSSQSARTLIDAVATGTTADGAPSSAPKPVDRRERRFRLRADETVPDGIRRVARGRLARGADDFAGVTEADLGEAVHSTRKHLKRVRATLRLSRDGIGEDTYQRENTHMRMIAGRLSGARDARVLLDTLAALEERFEDELPPNATVALRERLKDDHERELASLAEEGVADTTLQALEEASARTAEWTFERDGFDALRPGLRRIYRRGRKRLRAACAEPSVENLHEYRKRVKDLWHAAQLVRPAHPKRMKRLSRRAHDVADLLGDDHDLSVLRDYIEVHPQLVEDAASRDALLAVLDRRRNVLRRRALKRGRRLYKRSPKRFVGSIERGWHKRAEKAAKPLAG